MSPTADRLAFSAHASLGRQLRAHELYVCSLDELWWAAGSPEHLFPTVWLRRVGEIVREVSWHMGALDPECRLLEDGPRSAVWPWPEVLEPRGDSQAGDTLAIPPVRALYALALDTWTDDPE